MAIELAITDETPEQAPAISDRDILDCFLAAPMNGSYRDYLLRAGRAIEALAKQPTCGNCDTRVPPGCDGIFKDDGGSCALNVSEDPELLRQCHLSGQMSAAQSVAHHGV